MIEQIGFGYDVHPLVPSRPLVLGGIRIPYPRGLTGHSDADVLVHAIIDAILGGLGKGGIGEHFPDTDPAYQGISSLLLLEKTRVLCENERKSIQHLDATLVCEAPKLVGYFPKMKEKLARVLGIEAGQLNVKAKRNEGLGFLGRGEGIAAFAVCLLGPRKVAQKSPKKTQRKRRRKN